MKLSCWHTCRLKSISVPKLPPVLRKKRWTACICEDSGCTATTLVWRNVSLISSRKSFLMIKTSPCLFMCCPPMLFVCNCCSLSKVYLKSIYVAVMCGCYIILIALHCIVCDMHVTVYTSRHHARHFHPPSCHHSYTIHLLNSYFFSLSLLCCMSHVMQCIGLIWCFIEIVVLSSCFRSIIVYGERSDCCCLVTEINYLLLFAYFEFTTYILLSPIIISNYLQFISILAHI